MDNPQPQDFPEVNILLGPVNRKDEIILGPVIPQEWDIVPFKDTPNRGDRHVGFGKKTEAKNRKFISNSDLTTNDQE